MKVAILGFGPAGLIAAHTLLQESRQLEIDIFGDTKTGKSKIGGAQYLHAPLDDRDEPDGEIDFVKLGEEEGYRSKIYPQGTTLTSWQNYDGIVPAWSLGKVYDKLWQTWGPNIQHRVFNGMDLVAMLEATKYDLVFSSIPLPALCVAPESHGFPKVDIRLAQWTPLGNEIDNLVMYSGRECDTWYRTSRIFGEGWAEFGSKAGEALVYDPCWMGKPKAVPLLHGVKPLGTDCCCFPHVHRIGRFGTWDRKLLLHHVPDQVRAAL